MSDSEFRPATKQIVAMVFIIAATYFYFLLFTEFALLDLAEPFVKSGLPLPAVLGGLGAGGIAGGILAARLFSLENYHLRLGSWLAASAFTAAAILLAKSPELFIPIATAVGLSLGGLAVTLAAGARPVLGTHHLGLWCGLGTGLAYGVSNIPPILNAEPVVQTELAATVALLAALVARSLRTNKQVLSLSPDYSPGARVVWVIVLFAFVALDSCSFYVVQNTAALKDQLWSSGETLIVVALTHFIAAWLAGYALDHSWAGRSLVSAAALLGVACWLIAGDSPWRGLAPIAYAAAVSIYSTALIFYPIRSGRASIAAAVYGFAGWGGSAIGIGLAQGRTTPSLFFAAIALPIIFGGIGLREMWRRQLEESQF